MTINLVKLQAILAKQKRRIKGISYNPALVIRYERGLLSLVRVLERAALDYIDVLRQYGYIHDSTFTPDTMPRFDLKQQMKNLDSWAEEKAKKFADGVEEFHRDTWRRELNEKTGTDFKKIIKADRIKPTIDKAVQNNVDLIKSIPQEYHDRVTIAINEGIIEGKDGKSLKDSIKEIGGITESRARLIARDQTSKLLSDLNKARQTELGIEWYIWSTVGDSRVRETHAKNNGKRFRWDSPPDTGHPGEDVQCRCVADPDFGGLIGLKE